MPSPEVPAYSLEVPGITFPARTEHGYYPLSNGELFISEELLLFDFLNLARVYRHETDYPTPDVVIGIGKGGLTDMQRFAYLLGSKNEDQKSNTRVLAAQTVKYGPDNKPLPEPKILHCPDESALAGAKFIVVDDDMVDKGGSLDLIFERVDAAKPLGAKVVSAVAVAKLYEGTDGVARPLANADVVGRYIGEKWVQLSNQFEKFGYWYKILREMEQTYPGWQDEVRMYSPLNIIPEFFPEELAA